MTSKGRGRRACVLALSLFFSNFYSDPVVAEEQPETSVVTDEENPFMDLSGRWDEPVGVGGGASFRMTHGTVDYEVTEDMIDNTIPNGYAINPDTQGKAKDGAYDAYFLKDGIQEVRIEIAENNLNYVLQHADEKAQALATSVTIGDTTIQYCGFKSKGNYTLQHAYDENPYSDRFSFSINFGKYVKKAVYGETQNFYGVQKISFNNFFFDKSMLKEYTALQLMEEMGLPTPQHGLAKLYINDEYYGVYAMVENLEDSILKQYYGVGSSELSSYLTKPSHTKLNYMNLKRNNAPLYEDDPDTYKDVADMLPTVMEWVRKLNCLSKGTDFDENPIDVDSEAYLTLLSQIMDVDEVLRYFATHSFLVQIDNMFDTQQNFGLYVDKSGKALLLPWDYDLSYGTFHPGTAERTANYRLDILFRDDWLRTGNGDTLYGSEKDVYAEFPLFNVIYQNTSLMEQYRAYMKECAQITALGGTLASTGAVYAPGHMADMVNAVKEELIEAATEKLADHVYYMNGINQPADVRKAIPNLLKILALRSVGVYMQTESTGYKVSGKGCDMSAVGNGVPDWEGASGKLCVVDAGTNAYIYGTFTHKDTGNQGWGFQEFGATFTMTELRETSGTYKAVMEQTLPEYEAITMYTAKCSPSTNEVVFHLPVDPALAQKEALTFYTFADNTLTELPVTLTDGHIYEAKMTLPQTLVILQKKVEEETEAPTEEETESEAGSENALPPSQNTTEPAKDNAGKDDTPVWFIPVIVGGCALLLGAGFLLGKKRQ